MGLPGSRIEGEIAFFKGIAFVQLKGGDPADTKECASNSVTVSIEAKTIFRP